MTQQRLFERVLRESVGINYWATDSDKSNALYLWNSRDAAEDYASRTDSDEVWKVILGNHIQIAPISLIEDMLCSLDSFEIEEQMERVCKDEGYAGMRYGACLSGQRKPEVVLFDRRAVYTVERE